MKKITLILSCFSLLLFACTTSETPSPSPTPGTPGTPGGTTTYPYYANYTFNGVNYNLKIHDGNAQFSPDFYAIGGWQIHYASKDPALKVAIYFDHEPTHEDVMALAGRTFSTDRNEPEHVNLTVNTTWLGDDWFSTDTTSGNFLTVDSVGYVREGQYLFAPVDAYVITGTCAARMSNWGTGATAELQNCNFRMLLARVK